MKYDVVEEKRECSEDCLAAGWCMCKIEALLVYSLSEMNNLSVEQLLFKLRCNLPEVSLGRETRCEPDCQRHLGSGGRGFLVGFQYVIYPP